jgi:hypothetical protein
VANLEAKRMHLAVLHHPFAARHANLAGKSESPRPSAAQSAASGAQPTMRTQDGGSTSRRIEPESKTVPPLADGTAASSALATADALIGL